MKLTRGLLCSVAVVLLAQAFGACSSDGSVGQNTGTAGQAGQNTAGSGGVTPADAGPDTANDRDGAVDASAFDDLIELWVNGICAAITPCCVQDHLIGDEAHCRASLHALLDAAEPKPDPNLDRASALACIQEAIALAEQCDPSFWTPPACDGPGTKSPGSTCEHDDECIAPAAGKAECRYGENTKICQQLVHGKAGDPCVWTCESPDVMNCFSGYGVDDPIQVVCFASDGLTCVGKTCTPASSLGEACQTFACGPDALCSAEAVCEAKRPLGASCPEFSFEFDESCASGLYCKDAKIGQLHSGTCAPMSELGDLCSVSEQCSTKNCHQGVCKPSFKFGTWLCK